MMEPKFEALLDRRVGVYRTETECWEWKGHRQAGYGRAWFKEKVWQAHRLVFETINQPLAKGFFLDHLCRNKACVNPAHLEVVTHRENVMRGDAAKPRKEVLARAREWQARAEAAEAKLAALAESDGAGQQGERERFEIAYAAEYPEQEDWTKVTDTRFGNGQYINEARSHKTAAWWAWQASQYGKTSAPPVAEDGLPARYTDEDAKEWNRRLGEVQAAHPSTDKRTNLPLIKTMNVVGKTLVAQLREALRKQVSKGGQG